MCQLHTKIRISTTYHKFFCWWSPLFRNIGWFNGWTEGLTHVWILFGGHPSFHRPKPFRTPPPEQALLWPLASLGLPAFNAEHDWSWMPSKNWLHFKLDMQPCKNWTHLSVKSLKLNYIKRFTYYKVMSMETPSPSNLWLWFCFRC